MNRKRQIYFIILTMAPYWSFIVVAMIVLHRRGSATTIEAN